MQSEILERLRKPFVVVVAAAWLALGLRAGAAEPRSLISKGPYIQAPAADTMVLMWESLTNAPGKVRFGLDGKLDLEADVIHPRTLKGRNPNATTQPARGAAPEAFYIYEVPLKDLQPGTTYSYCVEFAGVRTAVHQFKTFTPGAETARFIVYGDTRSDPQVHAGLAASFRQQAPDFILHTGDLVARGRDYGLWAKEFFTPMATVINEVPFFSVIGNHEEDGTNYLAYFHLPGKELWYSLDVGPVHVLALDYQFQSSASEQFRFASNDLATARAPWKIVILHTPMFNIGGHASRWGHANYLPLFLQARVDLVLSGHSHLYERFWPMAPKGEQDWAITHVTTGGGGANLHPSYDHPALVVRETTNHYMLFEARRDTLQAKTIRANGTLLDTFELRKQDGRIPPAYLAQVYREETLQLFYDAVPSLAGRAASVPNTNQSARVLLNLAPREASSGPAELEITLAPESAPYYELEGGPLRATTPPAGQTNSVLWASVRASGTAQITLGKGDELFPPLVLMARVRCGEEQTIAYGARCRLSKTAAAAVK